MAKSGMWRRRSHSAIGIGRRQIGGDVVGDAILERGDGAVVAGGAQAVHARLGEILVFLADRLRRVDEFDGGLAAKSPAGGGGELGEAARPSRADVEEPVDPLVAPQPQHHVDAVAHIDEVAALAAIGIVGAVRAEEPRRLAAAKPRHEFGDEAHHLALVSLIGAVDIEEFEAGPMRRAGRARFDEAGDAPVGEVLRPAIDVERLEAGEAGARPVIVEPGLAVAVCGGRGSIEEGHAGRRAPVPEPHRQGEIGAEHEVGVVLGRRGDGAQMKDRLDLAGFGGEEALELFRGDERRQLALGEVPPFLAAAQAVADGEVLPAGLIQGGDEVRADEAGVAGHKDHRGRVQLVASIGRCYRPRPRGPEAATARSRNSGFAARPAVVAGMGAAAPGVDLIGAGAGANVMQTENRFFDDLARVATGALGAFTGMRAEVEARLRDQMERLLSRMDLVTREEFAAVQAMAAKARGEQERLEQRLLAIEARLQALEAAAGERAVAEAAAAEKPAAEKPKRRGGERPAAADESETG